MAPKYAGLGRLGLIGVGSVAGPERITMSLQSPQKVVEALLDPWYMSLVQKVGRMK